MPSCSGTRLHLVTSSFKLEHELELRVEERVLASQGSVLAALFLVVLVEEMPRQGDVQSSRRSNKLGVYT